MIERRPPADNPAGDGPEDVNALLDTLRRGEVLKKHHDTVTIYFQMGAGELVERVSFAGSPPAARKVRRMDPLSFSLSVSRSMNAGLSEFTLTTPDELERRERAHSAALAFWMWWRMEREVDADE